jgi:predicted transcriptional regulator
MSIRPEFANAFLSGEKVVEFRKRPVADDVSHVLIYATMPVGSLLGWFAVRGQQTMSPKGLWSTFRAVGGISKSRFFDYYDQREHGTGILVETAADSLNRSPCLNWARPFVPRRASSI